MSAKGNTTPIGTGEVGIDSSIQSAAGQAMQEMVSENNLKANLATNGDIKNLHEATIRMVSRWMPGDKLRILQTYGKVDMVSKRASADELDAAVATVLIAHLTKEELKKIIGREQAVVKDITKDVAMFNAKGAAARKSMSAALTYNNASSTFNNRNGANTAKNATNDKQLLKNLKNNGTNNLGPKDHAEFKKIRKELENVLKEMTNLQLSMIATNLEINIDDMDGTVSKDRMIKIICNMVNMYVILLLDKDPKGVQIAKFNGKVIKQIEDLLLLTSAGWMTGKAGINDLELRERRKQALEAKRNRDSNLRAKEIKDKAREKVKTKTYKHGSKKGLSEVTRSKSLGDKIFKQKRRKSDELDANARKIHDKLDKLDDEQIRALAESQGITNIEGKTTDTLRDELAIMGGSEMQQINDVVKKDLREAAKIKDPTKRAQRIEEIKANVKTAQKNSILSASMEGEKGSQEFSDKIPVVSFNQNGELVSTGLLKAVPVFIAGSASKLGKLMSKKEADDLKSTDSDELRSMFKDAFDESYADDKSAGSRKDKRRAKKIGKRISDSTIEGILAPKGSKWDSTHPKPETSNVIAGGLGTGGTMQQTVRNGAITSAAASLIGGGTGGINIDTEKFNEVQGKFAGFAEKSKAIAKSNSASLASDTRWTKDIDTKLKDEENQSRVPIKAFIRGTSGYIGERAGKVYNNAVVNRGAYINPVYVVNKGFDFFDNGLKETIKSTSSATQQIASQVEQLPTMFMGLQQGGTAFNAEAAASGVSMALNIANQAATAAAQFATGGSMKGGNRVSQIITGDHPQGKNNTELVSVDWGNRNINVKPIPMMATGGDVKSNNVSNITDVKRMTSSERSRPMVVSIGNGLVKYSKTLSDVEDDNSSTAVKVYSVNAGITEKVKVGDTEMSLFDAVYGMYISMAAMSNGISTSNQLLAAISGSSAAAAKTLGKIASSASGSGSPFSFTSELDDVLAGR